MSDKTKRILLIIVLLAILGVIAIAGASLYAFREQIFRQFYKSTPTSLQEGIKVGDKQKPDPADANPPSPETTGGRETLADRNAEKKDIEIIAENLQIPWEIAFLPDGDLLVTERPGMLNRIGKERRVYTIEGVEHISEGGLLGMALHPRFSENQWIYLYLTTRSGDSLINRVERYRFERDRLTEKTTIIDNIPGAAYHDGGRIAFGSDDYLYVTTGDAGKSNLAQNIKSLAGKILRIGDNGSIPSDNPFGNAVWSYGHRNSQGLTWDDEGRLWATEHGRSGILSGLDELNIIEKGKNYGWPVIQGDETKAGMESPIVQSGSDETWAPAGIAFLDGSLFFGGLRGESLYAAKIMEDRKVSLKSHFRQEFGRIRAVVLGPNNYLYITTSNTDGRGDPHSGDDKIIRINPEIFFRN